MCAIRRLVVLVLVTFMGTQTAVAQNAGCAGWRDPVGKKIVGGQATNLELWPSQAALRLSSPDGKRQLYTCGGTAIGTDSIMTAAHCFDDIERQPDGRYVSTDLDNATIGWQLDIVLGSDDLDRTSNANAYTVQAIVVHDSYVKHQATSGGNDIALVKLARRWSGSIATLTLDAAADPPANSGAALTVAGYGLLKGLPEGGAAQTHTHADGIVISAGSRRLQQVGVPMVATDKCLAEWTKVAPTSLIGPGQLCAGYEAVIDIKHWMDSCGGDSGGPIVHYDHRGCPTHVGLVSWGARSCGKPKAYGVYTRLSHHAAWLRHQVPDLLVNAAAASTAPTSSDLSPREFIVLAKAAMGGQPGIARMAVTGGPKVKDKRLYRFSVTSEVAGRLIIIDVNAEGIATQLFPNEHVLGADRALIRFGETVTVPGDGWGVVFRAGPPFGKGVLIALVVPTDFPVQLFVAAPQRTKGFSAERSAIGYFMNLLQQLTAHARTRNETTVSEGSAAWAITSIEYEVVP